MLQLLLQQHIFLAELHLQPLHFFVWQPEIQIKAKIKNNLIKIIF
jgi:hypothetical protein